MTYDPANRIVIDSYTGLFDSELNELIEIIQREINKLDIPDHVKKTLVVKIEKDPYFEEIENGIE